MLNYFVLFITLIFAVSGQIFLKKGSLVVGEIFKSPQDIIEFGLSMLKNLNILAGLAMFGIAFIMWVWVLSRVQLNIAYPIAVVVQLILLTAGSWFLLKESLSLVQIVGIGVMIFGIYLLLKPL